MPPHSSSIAALLFVDYEVASVKVQSYTIQQIRELQLYILIPFTPLRSRPVPKKIREEKYDVESAKLRKICAKICQKIF